MKQTSSSRVIPFELDKLYNRQRDIHKVFGGQEQSGIVTPKGSPFIFLFAHESDQFGYIDGWKSEGIFSYTGEGQVGDMALVRGNKALHDHIATGHELLLFEATKTSGLYRYLGCFGCAGFEYGRGLDRNGLDRKTIVFHLVPITQVENREPDEESEGNSAGKTLSELRSTAYVAASNEPQTPSASRRSFYRRNREVKNYVLARANGICEACGEKAPFERIDGTPYLEPHNTRRVSDGGPDDPRFIGAVCPTCHRKIHHGKSGNKLNDTLQKYIDDQERDPPGFLL